MKNGKKQTKLFIGLAAIVIIFSLIVASPFIISFTTQSSFPDDYQVFRVDYPIEYEYNLEVDKQGTITLPQGVNLDNVDKMFISVESCGSNIDIILNDEDLGTRTTTICENLFYDDPGSDIETQHYESWERTKTIDGLESRQITYLLDEKGTDSLEAPQYVEATLTVREQVECTRDTHCVAAAPICNQETHVCMTTEEDNGMGFFDAGTPVSIDTAPASQSTSGLLPTILILLSLVVLASLILVFKKKLDI